MGKSKQGNATTMTRARKDPKDGFTRTAIVAEGGDTGSLDVVNADGARLCLINISYLPSADGEETLIVDVIDVDKRYETRRAFAFGQGERVAIDVPRGGNLVSTDFRRKVPT